MIIINLMRHWYQCRIFDGNFLRPTTILISTVEEAMMNSKLYDNPVHLERAIAHLAAYINKDLQI
jgi:hypothetical protein